MLKIRLQRIGKRGQAHFRVVVLEHTVKPKGEYLELLGTYNPHQKEFKVEKDRIDYWVSKGAQTSPTVNNLLVNYKIWDKPKMQSWKPKQRPEPAEGASPEPAEGASPEPAEGKKEQPATDDKQPATPEAEDKPKTEEQVEEEKKEAPKEESKKEPTTNDEQPITSETKENKAVPSEDGASLAPEGREESQGESKE